MIYPYMELKQIEFISFEEYKKRLIKKKPQIKKKNSKEILKDVERILKTFKK